MKTLLKSEYEILFGKNTKFLVDYFKYIMTNADTMVLKILGIYQINLNDKTHIFMIYENLLHGREDRQVFRTFDLKGSQLGRYVDVKFDLYKKGTGKLALKEKNFQLLFKKRLDIE